MGADVGSAAVRKLSTIRTVRAIALDSVSPSVTSRFASRQVESVPSALVVKSVQLRPSAKRKSSMAASPRRRSRWVVGLLAAAWTPILATQSSTPPREEQEHFLLTARITRTKDIGKGVTHPVRLTLSDGGLTHDAAFVTVDEREPIMRMKGGRTELDFVDSYKYTIAAYRLAVLLGLDDMMPVTVEREVDHHKGALSWWVDDVKFDEGQRLKLKTSAPDPAAWNQQMYRMRVFTQLVADTDRNVGNVLITNDWKLWMIDFTRAFRHSHQLLKPGDVTRCDRQLLTKLRALTKEQVAAVTKRFIGGAEIDPLMARRDALVALVDRLIAEKGEAQVLY
jgi:hypothetical protein